MEELQEKYLTQLATKLKVEKAKAAELIDVCIRMTALKLRMEYSEVYNMIYEVEFLASCLVQDCSALELEECRKSCQCVEFEGKCYPKHFKDATKMNDDPDSYIEKYANGKPMPTDVLLKIVKLASYLYYNYDGGGLNDNTFDALEYHLNKRLKLRGRRYEKIGAPPIDKIRTNLPFPMASLNKVKPGSRELLDFLALTGDAIDQTLLWSLKLDGVSGLVVYANGKLSKIYTRGDGTIGGDVTYLRDFIKFPDLPLNTKTPNIVVRGEFILPKSTWYEKYAAPPGTRHTGNYSNPRSFVSAKINSGHVSQGISDIQFVAYEIVRLDSNEETGIIPSPGDSLEILKTIGFEIVQHGTLKNPTVFDLITLYKDVRTAEATKYNIDGLVLSLNIKRKYAPVKLGAVNPKYSVAFKMRLEEQTRQTKVLNVEWRKTRYGKLFPVVIFESVYIDGVRLHKASGHNAAHIRDWSMGRGTIIKVVRSGDVIPMIVNVVVDEKIAPIMPDPAVTGPWYWKGHDIIMNDPDSDRTVQIKRIEHFFATIGVPRLREKTIEKLWDAGMKDIRSITSATPKDFIKIKGIGTKTSESHFKNIHEVMRNTRMDRYIPASTTFNLGIGRKLVKQLLRFHPSVLSEDTHTIKVMLTKKKIPGFAAKRIENVSENVPKFREFLLSLNKEDIEYAMKKDEERRERSKTGTYNPLVRGKTFVLTGFYGKFPLDLEDYIYDNLGNFSDSVTSSTSAVIASSITEASKKMLEAQKLGIKVLSLEEFRKAYNIPSFKVEDGDGDGPDEDTKLGIVHEDDE